jgi:triosephosphate isomerase
VEIAVIPPYPFLRDVGQAIESSGIKLGAQNVYFESKGAYTGAVSAPMLASMGVHYSLIGHSERRKVFHESDEDINKSLLAVQNAGMTPILCIGETKEEFEQGLNENVCTTQLVKGLRNLR